MDCLQVQGKIQVHCLLCPIPTKHVTGLPLLSVKFILTGTTYPDVLEESLITILEEEGPNVVLQHDSLRLLKTEEFPGNISAQAA